MKNVRIIAFMRIGLISDTHGYLDERLIMHLNAVDEIWHAGDIGTIDLLQKLEEMKPLVSVYGNIDGKEIRAASKEYEIIERDGIKFLMIHIAGSLPKYNPRVRELIKEYQPKFLICGHSHILKIKPDPVNALIYMNPGAAGNHGFHKVKTMLRFDINNGELKNLEVVEFGKRGQLK